MNYKLLIPTYRNRFRFIRESLTQFEDKSTLKKVLNLGTGEGDYDAMIAGYCDQLTSCDINEEDIAFARELNKEVENIEYRVENALKLSFPDNYFDLIISVDVIEHVGDPEKMMDEITRVLKPGGILMITFPSLKFPITYDPINRILSTFSTKKISQGAYAFGHEYLIDPVKFREWTSIRQFKVVRERNLSGYLIALLEMYWTGLVQKLFKANSDNLPGQETKQISLRPSKSEPWLTRITDGLINFDHTLFNKTKHSVGKGFIIQKQ
ncbi:MAG: hypothetical protein DHS20C18_03690 [Saprospiraceae bacterium]|nr:MAG: hypothetical protein DHS20C18_03690 [Saprospiraceae bacterium]